VAVVAHALDFLTWHTLAIEHGLSDPQVIDLMLALVRCGVSPEN
jgi:hypothetical protein